MKKSIFAVLLAFVLFATMSASAETLSEFFEGLSVPKNLDVSVNANIEVKRAQASKFTDGPVAVTKSTYGSWPTFDFRATMYMDTVRNAFQHYMTVARILTADDAALQAELNDTPVRGGFTVTVRYPSSLTVSSDFLHASDMSGFSNNVNNIFKEISRKETRKGSWKTLTIEIAVKSPDGMRDYVSAKELEDNLTAYLPDFTLTCHKVGTSEYGSFPVYGEVTGYTYLGGNADGTDVIGTVHYEAQQLEGVHNVNNGLSAVVKVIRDSYSGGEGGGGIITDPSTPSTPTTPGDDNNVNVVFEIGGDTTVVDSESGEGVVSVELGKITPPTRDGYVFDGWYTDPACTQKASGLVTVDKDTVFYGKWINLTAPSVLNGDAHIAYIRGYEDGTIRPDNSITREEITTLLYRLLQANERDAIRSETNNFSDVEADRWSNTPISTMANGSYILGYPDGTFLPAQPVTRAEFVTIINRFYTSEEQTTNNGFYDAAGHWAEDEIRVAVARGFITGYEDGTFRPDNAISRAEAVTILNRMLVRHVDADGLCDGALQWPDNLQTAWYYYQMLEASNSHEFVRRSDKYNEDWSTVLPTPAWTE